ncbi:UDP-glycosyltransferase 71K1 [Ricinus communis]|uniref:Glycosyltransferase n=1 Tax=Ricinus communis TaxID=3988 RepID=B9SI10_RICCO|nr:UDP-glycosyltransferase 71K1 [Ricinus communis]XP_025014301.1 UDP-glycosyltransferase 71K1 [Ricinus communis]XP_048225625.1 UDP-glycosyltransferase 71K1 [Ricinus communis]EEF36747.1 UDP-glucosyltransferase, putative [Ricinus communis]|eukprot:XP_002525629.1 UDP-glycosyltransferase 71K1 [Ricinus communis]
MGKAELIFIPAPGVGHIVSTIEFANSLIKQDGQLFITILVMKLPITPFLDAYTKSLTASQPNINLIDLPQVDLPSLQLFKKSVESYVVDLIDRYKPHVKNVVTDIMSSRTSSDSVSVVGIVLDFFCGCMIDIGNEMGLPSFIFLTSGSGFLNLMLYLPSRHEQIGTEFSSSDPDVSIPGFVNSVPVTVLPAAVFNTDGGYDAYIKVAQRFKDAKGIIINTFTELEPYAIEPFNNGQAPKVYPVGPVLNLKGQPHPDMNRSQWDKIMEWLDEQPESSAVFLCFGSAGFFNVPQVKEIALGLEQSGCKFLWSLRVPLIQDEGTQIIKKPEEMLPEGFLERVEGRGMVCGWAPQVEVLGHKAIGGFVSHCGWNSILESLWHAVPIVTLPIYAEQQLNAFTMARELGLAVDLKLDYRPNGEIAKAEEVERALKCLMDSDSEVRKKVKDMAGMARKAGMEGGSSFNSILQFIEDIKGSSY